MEKKVIIGIIAVLLIIVAGSFLAENDSSTVPGLSGGAQSFEDYTGPPLFLDTIEFEGTIIDLSVSGGEGENVSEPYDTALVKVDRINAVNVPHDDWPAFSKIEEGKNIFVEFEYSARPAKIRQVPGPVDYEKFYHPRRDPRSISSAVLSFTEENGFFIFTTRCLLLFDKPCGVGVTITEEMEKELPGLSEGVRFRAIGFYDFGSPFQPLQIGYYELLP
jgi:hypothetical protein